MSYDRPQRKPSIFSYPDQVWGPKCNDFDGCSCDVMDRYSIRGYGYERAKVMEIGIAPGRQEEIWGAPLVGPSGERNDSCLRAVKFPRKKVYATNLICWRRDDPSQEEIAACWPRLKAEIESVRPRLILALGALACEWLTGYQIGKVRGNTIRPEYNRSPHFAEISPFSDRSSDGERPFLPTVLPTWHPAATLRIASLATDVIRDYAKIRPFLAGRLEPLQWDHRVVLDRAEAQTILDSLSGKTVAIDVETETDIADSFGKIICVAMAVRDDRVGITPDGEESFEYYTAWVFPVEVLRGLRWPKRVRWLEHNMGYDNPIIKREYSVWLTGVTCTMTMSQCIDERPGRDEDSTQERSRSGEAKKPVGPGYHGLKQLAAEYCGAPPGYGDEMKKFFKFTLAQIAAPKMIPLTEQEIEERQHILDRSRSVALEDTKGAGSRPGQRDGQDGKDHHGAKEDLTRVPERVTTLVASGGLVANDASNDPPISADIAAGTDIPKKAAKAKKPTIPMRLETEEEAATRFRAFLEALYRYNAFDAVNTVALPGRFLKSPCAAFEPYIMPAARAYARIHLTGIPVDVDRARELQAEWEPWIKDLEAELQLEAFEAGYRNRPKLKRDLTAELAYENEHGEGSWPLGIPVDDRKAMTPEARAQAQLDHEAEWGPNSWPGYEPLNLGSSQQLAKFLYGTLRIKVKVRSKKTGKPSVGKEAIADISHPFVDRMEEVRTATHIKGSHLDPIPELIKGDGRLHAHIWPIGAVNYRRSITDPPMQQFPKEHPKPFWKKLAEVRSVIRPDPGFCFMESDYKQIELHGAARISGDPVFLADLESGDYHTKQVRETFHVDADPSTVVFDHTRRLAKVFNFAVIYLVEEYTLAKTMNEGAAFGANTRAVTPAEAGRLIRAWYMRNRRYWQWQKEVIAEVKKTGRLVNPFGAVRRFPLYDKMLDKQIVNWPISSTCGMHSEISCTELEPIVRRELGGSILFDTHDSLLFHIPIKKRNTARRIIQEVMEEPKVPGWAPLSVEFKYTETSWRDMHDWKEGEDPHGSQHPATLQRGGHHHRGNTARQARDRRPAQVR